MHTVETVLLVILLGSITGIVARYLRAVPLPLIQIALGALLAWPQQGLHIAFDPELFLALFIPPLLFADGWRTNSSRCGGRSSSWRSGSCWSR